MIDNCVNVESYLIVSSNNNASCVRDQNIHCIVPGIKYLHTCLITQHLLWLDSGCCYCTVWVCSVCTFLSNSTRLCPIHPGCNCVCMCCRWSRRNRIKWWERWTGVISRQRRRYDCHHEEVEHHGCPVGIPVLCASGLVNAFDSRRRISLELFICLLYCDKEKQRNSICTFPRFMFYRSFALYYNRLTKKNV